MRRAVWKKKSTVVLLCQQELYTTPFLAVPNWSGWAGRSHRLGSAQGPVVVAYLLSNPRQHQCHSQSGYCGIPAPSGGLCSAALASLPPHPKMAWPGLARERAQKRWTTQNIGPPGPFPVVIMANPPFLVKCCKILHCCL